MISQTTYSSGTNRQGIRFSRGFTLIEIIVVVAIIGVMVAALGVSMSRDSDRLARLEAKRFHAIVNEVRDEAILSGEAILLIVEEASGSYYFNAVRADRLTTFDDGLFRRREIERGVGLSWEVFDQLYAKGDKDSQVLITPLGELTPFETSFVGDEHTYLVYVNEQNQLAQRTDKTKLF